MIPVWNGFAIRTFEFDGREAHVVFPKPGTENGRLALKTEYWNAFPATEIALLENGFHLCFIRNDNRWGTDADIERKARFVQSVAEKYKLDTRAALVGMSCGGLFAIKFAAKYPELVSCLYLDAPVLNYLSCPCGFGTGEPLAKGEAVKEILDALKLESVSELLGYRQMPLDYVPSLVKYRIPVIMVAGGKDASVPYHENGQLLQRAYEEAGVEFQLHFKPECDHHPHGLDTPDEIVKFIQAH